MLGLGLLADEIDRKRPPSELKKQLYRRKGWLWGGMPDWSNPHAIVVEARRDIGQAGVVRAFSAFDLFMDEIAADLARWIAFSKQEPSSTEDENDEPDRAARFYRSIGGTPAAVGFLWPVYRYFRFARDCIVHRDGIASKALEETYRDPDLTAALADWVKRTGEMTAPEIIPVEAGCLIDLNHRQAISASSVLRLIALDINGQALQLLGVPGLVYLAAHKIFFDDEPIVDVTGYGSMLKALNWILAGRYRVRAFKDGATARVLRDLKLTKDCSARFLEIKRTAQAQT
jgi:hypothetical protein